MRTTLEIPKNLIDEAMEITQSSTKTEVIQLALANLIQKEKIKEIKNFYGKIDLDIDLTALRKR